MFIKFKSIYDRNHIWCDILPNFFHASPILCLVWSKSHFEYHESWSVNRGWCYKDLPSSRTESEIILWFTYSKSVLHELFYFVNSWMNALNKWTYTTRMSFLLSLIYFIIILIHTRLFLILWFTYSRVQIWFKLVWFCSCLILLRDW